MANAQTTDKEPHVNPNQAEIDTINDRKTLIEAQSGLLKAQTELIKNTYPALGDVGKKGALSIESGERDKFHVTLRSSEAFDAVAKNVVEIVKTHVPNDRITLLVDGDRSAVAVYVAEDIALGALDAKITALLQKPAPVAPQALGTGLFELGTALVSVAQFTQLFRTDTSLAFTDSQLPDELLTDLIAVKMKDKVLYPAGELDRFLLKDVESAFAKRLKVVLARRGDLLAKGDAAKEVLQELTAFAGRLLATDAATKTIGLFNVLRGELVQQHMTDSKGLTLTVKVVTKGGASMKTSSIWREDRLYASGGLIATYRIAETIPQARVVATDVVSSESGFHQVPLKRAR